MGWAQEEGGQKREIKPGDVVWTPPGVKHWHGATATTGVGHIAITIDPAWVILNSRARRSSLAE